MNTTEHQAPIKRIREKKGISQRQLEKLTGISRKTFQRWENENYMPRLTAQQFKALLDILECELSDLIDYDQQAA